MGCANSIPQKSIAQAPAVALKADAALEKTPPTAIDTLWLAPGKPVLTLAAADEMANAALREAKERKFKDVSVFVLDAAGRTIVSKTMLGCPNLVPELARGKAMLCVSIHSSSRAAKEKYVRQDAADRTPQLLAMGEIGAMISQPIAAFPGGVLCRDAAKNVIGAIGVSGAAADEDEHCAITAAQSIGLKTEPAASALPDA